MATVAAPSTALTSTPDLARETSSKVGDAAKIDIVHLSVEGDDVEEVRSETSHPSRTILHIYFEQPCHHKTITPVLSPSQERRFGPSSKQQKERRTAKKNERLLREEADDTHNTLAPSNSTAPLPTEAPPVVKEEDRVTSYFLHTPYLSFHTPPSVLYTGTSRYAPATPLALIHTGCFWRTYKIQLGPSLSLPGVIDPRGVVCRAHHSSAAEQKADARALKGYRVRGWRLWGESGRKYVDGVRRARRTGAEFADPDVDSPAAARDDGKGAPAAGRVRARADHAVLLRWTRPLSRHAREYAFRFCGVEFYWKGTGTVGEARRCGWMLRFCHLKLVARGPADATTKEGAGGLSEVCLARYTSSVAAEKCGTLEVFDGAVLRVVGEWMPGLLDEGGEACGRGIGEVERGDESGDVARLKESVLYQLIVATVLCVASAEKEKRHTLIDLIVGIAENGGNGGG